MPMEFDNISNRRRVNIHCKHNQRPPCFVIDTMRRDIPVVLFVQENPNECITSNQPINVFPARGTALQYNITIP